MGQIVKFPTSKEYTQFVEDSAIRTKALIETLTLSYEKGMLNEKNFTYLLNYMNLNLYKDFTPSDLAIIKFHCNNYYHLQLSIW